MVIESRWRDRAVLRTILVVSPWGSRIACHSRDLSRQMLPCDRIAWKSELVRVILLGVLKDRQGVRQNV